LTNTGIPVCAEKGIDPIYMLSYLFVGGAPPPPPFIECGADPTEDALDCDNFDYCP